MTHQAYFADWHTLDLDTWELLPNHSDLIGSSYTDEEGTHLVIDVDPLFPDSRVVIAVGSDRGRSVSASHVRELLAPVDERVRGERHETS